MKEKYYIMVLFVELGISLPCRFLIFQKKNSSKASPNARFTKHFSYYICTLKKLEELRNLELERTKSRGSTRLSRLYEIKKTP